MKDGKDLNKEEFTLVLLFLALFAYAMFSWISTDRQNNLNLVKIHYYKTLYPETSEYRIDSIANDSVQRKDSTRASHETPMIDWTN